MAYHNEHQENLQQCLKTVQRELVYLGKNKNCGSWARHSEFNKKALTPQEFHQKFMCSSSYNFHGVSVQAQKMPLTRQDLSL